MPLPFRQPHEIDRKIAVSQSQASVSGLEAQGPPEAVLGARSAEAVSRDCRVASLAQPGECDRGRSLSGKQSTDRWISLLLERIVELHRGMSAAGGDPSNARCLPRRRGRSGWIGGSPRRVVCWGAANSLGNCGADWTRNRPSPFPSEPLVMLAWLWAVPEHGRTSQPVPREAAPVRLFAMSA